MENQYTAIVKQDGKWWIGWIEEVPGVNCQEASREELMASLRETLREIIESRLAEMAADPHITDEVAEIQLEFSDAELDGLTDLL